MNQIQKKLESPGFYGLSQHIILERLFNERLESIPSTSYLALKCDSMGIIPNFQPAEIWHFINEQLGGWRPTISANFIDEYRRGVHKSFDDFGVSRELEAEVCEQAIHRLFGITCKKLILFEGELVWPADIYDQILHDVDTGVSLECLPEMRVSAGKNPEVFFDW